MATRQIKAKNFFDLDDGSAGDFASITSPLVTAARELSKVKMERSAAVEEDFVIDTVYQPVRPISKSTTAAGDVQL